ncbi:MAG TPA: DUF4349 domain-containing protein [Actinomycetota bacterium]|jgi:hypothetical protein|nr:DUF4349 domain-containing protein [Actinomycetota bacterium]
METDIRYLDSLEQDLRRAADFEAAQSPAPTPHRRRGKSWLGIAAGLLAFLLIAGVVGFLSGSGRNDSMSAVGGGGEEPAAGTPGEQGTQVPGGPMKAEIDYFDQRNGLHNLASDDRPGVAGDLTKIIRKGDLAITLPRDGLGNAVDEVTAIANEKEGFVFSSSVGERAGSLVLRVPASRFDATVTALRGIGTVKDVTIASQDVTAEFIDLNARLRIALGRRHVLQRLYAQATTIEQTIRVLNALDDTQLRIEQAQGQLNVIENQTSQSTIRVSLREEGLPDPQTQDVRNPSIGSAWDRSIAGFFGVISAVVIGVGYLVPIAILALLILLVVTLVRRRRATSPAP